MVETIVALALGKTAVIQERPPLDFQSNQLFDVWHNGRHFIAKRYLKEAEQLDAPRREHAALQLLSSLDIAPQPKFFNAGLGPVVIYEFLDGRMWDRTPPTAVQLGKLATLWLTLNQLPTEDLWLSRGQEQSLPEIARMFHRYLEHYEQWAGQHFRPGLVAAAPCRRLLTHLPQVIEQFQKLAEPPLFFCRADPRFANVIQRPDGRLGLVDWEDCGLQDPARDVADLLTHPNQEDLLDDAAWSSFLKTYAAARRQTDPQFIERIHFYRFIFYIFWLLGLLNYGVSLAEAGQSLKEWQSNELPVNIRLRRYLALAQTWPDNITSEKLEAASEFTFFSTG